MKISIIGTGYVGLVTGTCLAELGHQVICVDNNKQKIDGLKKLILPIYEPGLEDLIKKNVKKKRLSFTTSIKEATKECQIIFIAVSTPPKDDGEADLTAIDNVAGAVAKAMDSYRLIVEKSTVPVETGMWIKQTIAINLPRKSKISFDVASNPEFLREGQAIKDFMHPDRIVIGVESKRAQDLLLKLYKPLNAPVLITDIKSAELIKHASNSFLATKISFINAISCICEKVGADVTRVAQGMGLDKRIGRNFLDAGVGYGGFCFPKDLDAFIHISQKIGYDFKLLKTVKDINEEQKLSFLKKIKDAMWILKDKNIAVLGLSFKPDTDDIRFAPSIEIIKCLQKEGARVKAYDPKGIKKARLSLPKVKFCENPYEAAKASDCLVIFTEWQEFKDLDLARIKKLLKQPIIIDGRNIYDLDKLKRLGFKYISIGRGFNG